MYFSPSQLIQAVQCISFLRTLLPATAPKTQRAAPIAHQLLLTRTSSGALFDQSSFQSDWLSRHRCAFHKSHAPASETGLVHGCRYGDQSTCLLGSKILCRHLSSADAERCRRLTEACC